MKLEELGTVVDTDVLVVGGAIAGLFAAIKAKEKDPSLRVALLDKCQSGASGCSAHAAGVLPYWAPGDNFDDYARDIIVNSSEYLIDQRYVEIALRESWDRFCDLMDYGVQVQRDIKGEPKRIPIIASSYGLATPFYGGTELTWKPRMKAVELGVNIFDRVYAADLLMEDSRCIGATGFNIRTGEFCIFRAKGTILANGAVFFGRRPQMGPAGTTGDAGAMALRAGAQYRNGEQLWATHGPAALDSSGVHVIFGSGGIIRNAKGDRIMEKYNPKLLEEARRWEVARGIVQEWKEGRGPCYLDCTHLPAETITTIYTSLPRLAIALREWGRDLSKDKIEWVPYGLTSQNVGGVRVNSADGDVTGVSGLWAVGNASDFCGGSDTAGVSALLGSSTMGARSGQRAAEQAAATPLASPDVSQVQGLKERLFAPLEVERASAMTFKDAATNLSQVMMRYVNLVKDEAMLQRATEELAKLEESFNGLVAKDNHDLMMVEGLKNKVLLGRVCAASALIRKESRACHYRSDFPARDDKGWLKWVVAKLEGGEPQTWTEDIPVHLWKYRPEVK